MKKVLLGLLILSVLQLPSLAKIQSSLFVVKNAQAKTYVTELSSKFAGATIKDELIYTLSELPSYVRVYQSGNDLNVFLMSDSKDETDYSAILKSLKYKTYSLEDKDLTNKYTTDYKNFLNINDITVNGIQADKNKYNPYDKKLKNKVLRTTTYTEKNIEFTTNKMNMKSAKLKKYAHGYEIVVKNNTGKNIKLKSVNSGNFIGLTEVAKQVVKCNGIDFIPVYGLIAGIKTDVEKNRFTRPFPQDYILKAGEDLRILGLSKMLVEPIVDFVFEIDGKETTIQLHTYQ